MIIGITGHRPDKLGGYDAHAFHHEIKMLIAETLVDLKATKLMSGMALGVDTLAVLAAQMLFIPYVAAIPFKGQESRWSDSSQILYRKLLLEADESVVVTAGGYAPWKLQKRNEWVVNNCDVLLGVWDGTAGGTCNCLRYAERVSKPMYLIRIQTINGELHAGQYHRVIGIEDTQRQQAQNI